MTIERAPPLCPPWFGVVSAIVPFLFGWCSFNWQVIADWAPLTDTAHVVMPVLFGLLCLGIGSAIIALVRKENWRWLAITAFVVNVVLMMGLALVVAAFLVLANTKIV